MIRNARPEDAGAMTDIYNFYIRESVATFDTDPLPTTTMSRHIASVSEGYPCLICKKKDKWPDSATHIHGRKRQPIDIHWKLRFIFIRNIPEKDWEDN